MLRSVSLEKINAPELVSNAAKTSFVRNPPENLSKLKKRRRSRCGNILERYHITIKPKLVKSSSLSDLTNISDSTFDCLDPNSSLLNNINLKSFYESSGDNIERYYGELLLRTPYMSWNFKGKKPKKNTTRSKYMADYIQPYQIDNNTSSYVEDTSICSADDNSNEKISFPFKSTPSGNLKVQSNQVVFQSATVGVLLADPTQAKVKVKIKGNSGEVENGPDLNTIDIGCESESQMQYERREAVNYPTQGRKMHAHHKSMNSNVGTKAEEEPNLVSLGYTTAEPVDWTRVQLPKKQDLFQEFYRRVHNYM